MMNAIDKLKPGYIGSWRRGMFGTWKFSTSQQPLFMHYVHCICNAETPSPNWFGAIDCKVWEAHHPRGTTLPEALPGILLLRAVLRGLYRGLFKGFDRGDLLQAPHPGKIQSSSKKRSDWKVTFRGRPQSSSKVTPKATFWSEKVSFESFFGSKSRFWGHFWATLAASPKVTFWSLLSYLKFEFFGVRGPVAGSHDQKKSREATTGRKKSSAKLSVSGTIAPCQYQCWAQERTRTHPHMFANASIRNVSFAWSHDTYLRARKHKFVQNCAKMRQSASMRCPLSYTPFGCHWANFPRTFFCLA